jgi:hypothetical protein
MGSVSSPTLARGQRVASHLGWQRSSQGFLGATSGLFDPFAGFKLPKSSVNLAQHYALRSHLATMRRINESAARLSQINRR